jgi:hypothetical protein
MKKIKQFWEKLRQTLLFRILEKIVKTVIMGVSAVFLTILYFTVIVPIGLIFKMRKIDLLKIKLNKSIDSYWEAVPVDGPSSRPQHPY